MRGSGRRPVRRQEATGAGDAGSGHVPRSRAGPPDARHRGATSTSGPASTTVARRGGDTGQQPSGLAGSRAGPRLRGATHSVRGGSSRWCRPPRPANPIPAESGPPEVSRAGRSAPRAQEIGDVHSANVSPPEVSRAGSPPREARKLCHVGQRPAAAEEALQTWTRRQPAAAMPQWDTHSAAAQPKPPASTSQCAPGRRPAHPTKPVTTNLQTRLDSVTFLSYAHSWVH